MSAHGRTAKTGPVVVATDLTDDAVPALVRGQAHADAVGAELVVCHIVPDVVRHHPLLPARGENDLTIGADLTRRAAELVTDQVGRVLKLGADAYRAVVETGAADEEIVRLAEREGASLIAVGARPRTTMERVLGNVAERVVRYAHTSVLVARPGHETRKVVVATDLGEGSTPALHLAQEIARAVPIEVTLVHVLDLPSPALAASLSPIGVYMPMPETAVAELAELGKSTLESLAKKHGFAASAQVNGDPATGIVERADALDAEMIILSSRGRTGFARLVLGSVAEKVIRRSTRSVLVVRQA